MGISLGAVQSILNILGMSKVFGRWVPIMMAEDLERSRFDISKYLRSRNEDDPEELMGLVVTQDETWVHHFDPESKKQSRQWKYPVSPFPKPFKRVSSAGKVGVIMVDYLVEGPTINGAYYAEELRRLRQEIVRKRRVKLTLGALLLQDNAPAHTSKAAMAAATECSFEVLPHSPHSPDLAPSDFFLFPKLKTNPRSRSFESNEGVIVAVNEYLEDHRRDKQSEQTMEKVHQDEGR